MTTIGQWTVPSDKLDRYLRELKPVYHNVGRSIIMPSGSGKSYWMKYLQHTTYGDWNAIPKQSFIDSDPLMIAMGAMPPLHGEDFSGGLTWNSDMEEICKRCDKVTVECKKKGVWIMGASWWDPALVDAYVILPEELNKTYLQGKKDIGEGFEGNYYEKTVVPYISILRGFANKYNIPVFNSIERCAMYIVNNDRTPPIFTVNNTGYTFCL
tara:strand:+ start:1405 stop:2037 length:633 start_codon:yes stop_codon:yes gene_type:complete